VVQQRLVAELELNKGLDDPDPLSPEVGHDVHNEVIVFCVTSTILLVQQEDTSVNGAEGPGPPATRTAVDHNGVGEHAL